ncbi:MAG: M23 family metallopeptidase [Vicinamibacterales bacterium]
MRAVRGLAAALCSGMTAIVVAACAPGSGVSREARDERPLAAGVGRDIVLPAEVRTLAGRVRSGATLSSLLEAHEIAQQEVAALIARAGAVFDVRALRTDRPYRIVQALGGALRRFEYELDDDRVLRVERNEADGFEAAIHPIEKRTELATIDGAIDREASSLLAAMARTGERIDLSLALADVLSSEIDFNTELQPGDRFRLLFEKQFRDSRELIAVPAGAGAGAGADVSADADGGQPRHRRPGVAGDAFAGYGAIHAAEFTNAGRLIRAVRFTPTGGTPQYFDAEGRSLKRAFLKSPLKFDPTITSRFSGSRKHPLLGFTRAHLGVDYRAPVGAPVLAVADGVVVSAGFRGGAGRMVHLRHANGMETQYLHLSATLVRSGQRVHQGDVIGKVGQTGLATGPHLDYRVRKQGTFVNPVRVHQEMPPGDPIAAVDRPAFEAARDRAFATLNQPVERAAPHTN